MLSKSAKKQKAKNRKALQGALQLVQNLKKLEEAGALRLIREKREVHLVTELFWDGKDADWKKNFLKNIHMLMERHLDTPTQLPIHIKKIDLDTKELSPLVIFLPATEKLM